MKITQLSREKKGIYVYSDRLTENDSDQVAEIYISGFGSADDNIKENER